MATMIARWISGVLAALAPGSARRSGKPALTGATTTGPAVGDIAEKLPGYIMDAFKSVIGDLAREGTVVCNLPPATLQRLIRERISRLRGNADEIDAVTASERATQLRPPFALRQIPPSEWEWFGSAAHFCCGQWCRFHLATRVGSVVVSTVGELVLPHHSGGSGRAESEWLAAHGPDDVGCGRKYETEAFRAATAATCACGCGVPRHGGGRSLDSAGYNTAAEATAGHRAMCERWAQAPFQSGESMREGGSPGKPAQG